MSCNDPPFPTKCDRWRPGDRNVWHPAGSEGAVGICLLDTMTDEQVIFSLQRDEVARVHLVAVTTDARLLELAATVERLPTAEPTDTDQTIGLRHNEPESIPFYGIFRGQPPFAQ